MDKRKLKIAGEVENGFLVETDIDEELKPSAAKQQAIIDEAAPLSKATS